MDALPKFCYQQIWTPLLQNKDIEIFTKNEKLTRFPQDYKVI